MVEYKFMYFMLMCVISKCKIGEFSFYLFIYYNVYWMKPETEPAILWTVPPLMFVL